MSPFARVPLRVDFVTSNDPCSFTLLFRDSPVGHGGEKSSLSGGRGNFPAASVDRGALSGRCRLKDARRGAASAGSV